MDKHYQIFLIKFKIMELLANMMKAEETVIEKKTILEFSKLLENF